MIDDLVNHPWHALLLLGIICTTVSMISGWRTLDRILTEEEQLRAARDVTGRIK